MAITSANSLFNSLKGKIWLATTALAFFICVFGLVSYLLVSFVINNTLYAVFLPFVFSAVSVIVFGWWLSDEVTSPVEKVSLLAKSLERGVSTTMPKTSGASETDELLASLQSIGGQVQRLVGSMENVANGNFDQAFSANLGTDRTGIIFQKLLGKVTESVHAKDELDKLRGSINRLATDVAKIRAGNLEVELTADSKVTKELAAVYRFLLDNLNEIVVQVNHVSSETDTSTEEVKNSLQTIIRHDETRIQDLAQASKTLHKLPNIVRKISEELSHSAQTAEKSIEKARTGNVFAMQNMNTVSILRKQIQEISTRIERLTERSQEVGKAAKTVEDLAQRTSLVALNATIQATELGEAGKGFLMISEEIERLAQRAENTNKQIATITQNIRGEIRDISMLLEMSATEASNLTKYALESGNALGDLEHYVAGFLNLQNKIVAYSNQQSDRTEQAFKVFTDEIAESENAVQSLKGSDEKLTEISEAAKSLQKLTSHLKSRRPETGTTPKETRNPLVVSEELRAVMANEMSEE